MSITSGRLIERTSRFTRRIVAPNPGPMTLDGTNSYLIGADAAASVVVDPGPVEPEHLGRLAEAGRVALVLLTHHHPDHSESLQEFARMTGAPVRALDAAFCVDAPALADGEVIEAAGVSICVVATPGHTADSVCFVLPDDEPLGSDEPLGPGGGSTPGSVLTGDTVLGRGTTIIADPDGALGPYLESLRRLREFGPALVLPGHGAVLPDLAAICDAYLAHRAERLDEVRAALADLGPDATAQAVTDVVYRDVDPSVRAAAEASMRAQLAYLRGGGRR
ncbi:MAG TPA: MBL fold metallo-hydrolase [Humibacter sp.]|nr:MBL fold metallo-hydrolase [Humibacter sp.]